MFSYSPCKISCDASIECIVIALNNIGISHEYDFILNWYWFSHITLIRIRVYYSPINILYTACTIGSVSWPWEIAHPNAPVIDNNTITHQTNTCDNITRDSTIYKSYKPW